MHLYPTRATFHVAVAGIAMVTLGAAARLSPVVGFGGAMLLAIALGRAIARVGVARLRSAGFEMTWADARRVRVVPRGGSIVIRSELRNGGDEPIRVSGLRPIASSLLSVTVEPDLLDLPPNAGATVDLTVRAPRVGRWGIHGLGLEVSVTPFGAKGAFEVPLLFANPLGIEVLPATLSAFVGSPRGGRTRRTAAAERPGRPAEGHDLRELRDYAPGDPFKRIAWKASARRGRLLVREMDRGDRGLIWLVVDASVELWAGPVGNAPLDLVVDDVASFAGACLRRGDWVGLIIVASRIQAWIEPRTGATHGSILARALASVAETVDADRSEIDEAEVARRVVEHARPLDPRGLADLRKGDLDALAARIDALRSRAPFSPPLPFGATLRERRLRHYLASFGIELPPRVDGERPEAERALATSLGRLSALRPRPDFVQVWAPPPSRPDLLASQVGALRAHGIEVCWSLPPFEAGLRLPHVDRVRPGAVEISAVVNEAVRVRAHAARERGERVLRRLGVRIVLARTGRRAGDANRRDLQDDPSRGESP